MAISTPVGRTFNKKAAEQLAARWRREGFKVHINLAPAVRGRKTIHTVLAQGAPQSSQVSAGEFEMNTPATSLGSPRQKGTRGPRQRDFDRA